MTTLNPGGFLIHPGGYRNLVCYKKSVILYDMTIYYIDKYLQLSDRTYGQMQQAARSGKQNIVEGLEDKMTSTDTGLHLVNVARGSMQELREDYAPYYEKWDKETVCNTALTLIHQADKGLMTLLQKMEAEFLAEGGVKERMFAARKNQRGF